MIVWPALIALVCFLTCFVFLARRYERLRRLRLQLAKRRHKNLALRPDQIKPLVQNRGGCIATDKITIDRLKVGYMYREQADNDIDSGWRFLSGQETQAYMDNTDNHAVYDLNTIANYDPEIIPFLNAPAGSAFERVSGTGAFVAIKRSRP
jgi:hypothetical protein